MRSPGLSLIAAMAALAAGPAIAGQTEACDSSAAANHARVLEFYRQALVEREPRPAFERYVSPDMIEHKPGIPGGTRDATVVMLAGLIEAEPQARWEILRSAAEGDLVFLHARFIPAPGAEAYAIADVFRLENCLIVEHWDVVSQPQDPGGNPHPRF